jgi:hypothetical protein
MVGNVNVSDTRRWLAWIGLLTLVVGVFSSIWLFQSSTDLGCSPTLNLCTAEIKDGVNPFALLVLIASVVLAAIAIMNRYGWVSAFPSGALALTAAFIILDNTITGEGVSYSSMRIGVAFALLVVPAALVIAGGVVGVLLQFRFPSLDTAPSRPLNKYVTLGVAVPIVLALGLTVMWYFS